MLWFVEIIAEEGRLEGMDARDEAMGDPVGEEEREPDGD